MTTWIDADGRLFGRVNVVDALCVLFALGLVPAAYVSWLLFRAATPQIRSVEPSAVTVAERRIAGGLPIRLKVKIRGEHLAPVLRATIDYVPAIGFTFETPHSADVIIGEDVPFGTHDLVLYDGVQEVARARAAITIPPPPTAPVHAIGALIELDEATAKQLQAGQRFEASGVAVAEIVALGETAHDRVAIADATGRVEPAVAGLWRRDAIVAMHCEPSTDEAICRVGNTTIGESTAATIEVPGARPRLRMQVLGVVPEARPRAATVRVRVPGHGELAGAIRAGDRDARWPAIDSRAAVVSTAARASSGDAVDLVVRLGVDRAPGGWRYHGQLLQPGGVFPLVTERYAVSGSIVDVVIDEH